MSSSDANWANAPADAEAWGPKTRGYRAGWYRTSLTGQWYFREPHQDFWCVLDHPTPYRQGQLERRP